MQQKKFKVKLPHWPKVENQHAIEKKKHNKHITNQIDSLKEKY